MTAAFPLPSLPRLQTLLETARQRVQAAAPWQACGQLEVLAAIETRQPQRAVEAITHHINSARALALQM